MDQAFVTRPTSPTVPAPSARSRRLASIRDSGHLALPGALTAALAFQAGGFFPGAVGLVGAILAGLALVRVTVAQRPFAGWSSLASVVGLAGAALASWTLLSALWSGSAGRALPEFDRTLVYVLTFFLLASIARGPRDLTVLLRWVLLAIVAVAVVGVATRLAPDLFPIAPGRAPARLAYPLTYWNAMGVICALGVVLALHASCGSQEPLLVRALAGAALPILALGVYFPFSRGGIATAVLGIALYVILAHPRRLLGTLATAVPAAAIALVSAYGADALAEDTYAKGAGPAQGHHVALVLVACMLGAFVARLALVRPEERLAGLGRRPARRRRLLVGAAVAAVAVLLVLGVAVDLPSRLSTQYHGFIQRDVAESGDARDRLGATANSGRLLMWRVDLDAFSSRPLHGTGAGTYHLQWDLRRGDKTGQVLDGHSLYLETLAELGLVGAVLLAVVLVGLLAGPTRGLGAVDRHANAAVLAAGVALLAHAGIDWDWEMPALFVWLFAAAGVACARRAVAGADGLLASAVPGRVPRLLAGLACLLLAITPFLVYRSQAALDRANAGFARGDCATAVDGALDSIQGLGARAEPYELLGYCDLRLGYLTLGLSAMEHARERDPDAWQYAYGVSVARALARRGDPLVAARAATRLSPREPLAHDLLAALRRARPARWPQVAARARIPTA